KSPWVKYEKIYDIELDSPIKVIIRKIFFIKLVHVKIFSIQVTIETLHIFRQFQYYNLVFTFETFTIDDSLYIVLEYILISLERIVKSPAYSNERQLATILEQINCRSLFKNIY
ncbi:hypothetical protein BDZ45DRAFT_597312, partial [Acephala macrosclerotiorum]